MKYTTQPLSDIDLILRVDFTEMPDLGVDDERLEWNLREAGRICRVIAQTGGAMAGFTGILFELGEIPAWAYLADVANHSGFDVYNSDTMLEVYRRSTVSDTEREGEDMPRQTVQDKIKGEIDKIDAKLAKLDAHKGELQAERTQLMQAHDALGEKPTAAAGRPQNDG